uniref:F-box domain-containing protein n=1 Tax=Syphacia muris TaxID=451379 RepID=A0A0N5AWP9_9BILA
MENLTCCSPSTSNEAVAVSELEPMKLPFKNCSKLPLCFDLLPENTIKQIYMNLHYTDVFRSHRVCKRIRNILQRNAHYFSRPKIAELGIKMGVVERRSRPIGRLQMPILECSKKMERRLYITYMRKRQSTIIFQKEFVIKENTEGDQYKLSPNFLECLDDHMKKLIIDGRLSFTGIAVDKELCERLMQRWVRISEATSLLFTLCRFRLNAELFRDLLISTNCRRLNIELSQFDDQIINDFVLEGMSECIEMRASGTYPRFFVGLTDRILNHWATQKMLPRRILLHNVYGNFTITGVLTMLNALHEKAQKCQRNEKCLLEKFEWNFGYVSYSGENDSLLEILSLPGHTLHTTYCADLANTIDVTLTAKGPLYDISASCYKCSPIIKFQLILNRLRTN